MRRRISIKGCVRPWVRPWVRGSVGPSVCPSVSIKGNAVYRVLGASYVGYPTLFNLQLFMVYSTKTYLSCSFVEFDSLLSVWLQRGLLWDHPPMSSPKTNFKINNLRRKKKIKKHIWLVSWAFSASSTDEQFHICQIRDARQNITGGFFLQTVS